jgi:glycosyltransferase involved in cell wall biosynthesis
VSYRILTVGPYSQTHGEAKIFKLSCNILSKHHKLTVIDHSYSNIRFIAHLITLLKIICYIPRNDIIYLSIPRRALLITIYLCVIRLMKIIMLQQKKIKVFYHVHGSELAIAYKRPTKRFHTYVYKKNIDTTIISSLDLLTSSLPDIRVNYKVLPNAVDIDIDIENQVTTHKKPFYVFVSFPSYNKRLDRVIARFSKFKSKHLIVVGWEKKDFDVIYGKRISCGDNIHFSGRLSYLETLNYIRDASGLVADSDSEAMPLVVAEAILLKKPCYLGPINGYKFYLNNFASVIPIEQLFFYLPSFQEIEDSFQEAQNHFSLNSYERNLLGILNVKE